jgi:glycosyltransferase involved in cell wall biosynthesis
LNNTQSTWGRAVKAAGGARLATGEVDVVFTTSGPFEHVRSVGELVRAHRTPWVADLRDPATVDVTVVGTRIERLVRLGRGPVCRALLGASALVAATQQVVEEDGKRLGAIELLLPGFDAEEWVVARHRAAPPTGVIEIVYAGQLYAAYRRPDLFLRGLRRASEHLGTDQIRLIYYGRDGAALREIAKREGCAELVDDRGFVPPAEMPTRLASASALLLLTNEVGATGVPGGKFYEYLAAHRPLLAVPASDRFVTQVLDDTQAGVGTADEEQVARQLVQWHEQLLATGSIPFAGRVDVIDRYSDAGTVERLAQLLDECREGAGRR